MLRLCLRLVLQTLFTHVVGFAGVAWLLHVALVVRLLVRVHVRWSLHDLRLLLACEQLLDVCCWVHIRLTLVEPTAE